MDRIPKKPPGRAEANLATVARIENINVAAKIINYAACLRLGRVTGMNTYLRIARLIATLAMLFPVLTSWANGSATVPDQRLVGHWHGTNQFFGMSHEEITEKKVAIQNVEVVLDISADGSVTGRVGGAELSECVVEANRGWFGRLLHIKTDFIIRGKVVGPVATGSDSGTHLINAPFNLDGTQVTGSIFVIRGAFTYPYPFLSLRLSR